MQEAESTRATRQAVSAGGLRVALSLAVGAVAYYQMGALAALLGLPVSGPGEGGPTGVTGAPVGFEIFLASRWVTALLLLALVFWLERAPLSSLGIGWPGLGDLALLPLFFVGATGRRAGIPWRGGRTRLARPASPRPG